MILDKNLINRKIISTIFFFILPFCYSQEKKNIQFKEKTIYIIARSTQSKEGLIASNFNIKDKILSHVGIGYIEADKLQVYNVSNYKINKKDSSHKLARASCSCLI